MMSVFQIFFVYHTLTQAIFKMTQLKMTCGTYDPLWQISRLNTVSIDILFYFIDIDI